MKILFRKYRNYYKWLIALVFSSLFLLKTHAQTPSNYPSPVPEPVNINPTNIIIYFILPVILVVAYIWIRKSARKKRIKETQNRKK